MTVLPDKLTETPDCFWGRPLMDVLSDILASLRLTGGVVIDGKLSGDFCVRSEFGPGHCAPFFPVPDTIIGYHYVRSGEVLVQAEDGTEVVLKAGEAAVVPRNDPHLLTRRPGLAPIDASEVGWVTGEGVHHVACGNGPDTTEVWCGFLGTEKSNAHPLLQSLPSVLKIDLREAEEEWVEASLRYVAQQVPSAEVVSRLAELFVAQAIREYVAVYRQARGDGLRGWPTRRSRGPWRSSTSVTPTSSTSKRLRARPGCRARCSANAS